MVSAHTLTPRQHRIITLLASGNSITRAAASENIHRNTIGYWRPTSLAFVRELQYAVREYRLRWHEQATALAPQAIAAIAVALTAPDSSRFLRFLCRPSFCNHGFRFASKIQRTVFCTISCVSQKGSLHMRLAAQPGPDAILNSTDRMNPSTSPLLTCEKLKKSYSSAGGELVVFSDLDLSVQPGERVAIVGESGSGKSSLLHLLGGLDRPTSGSIRYRSQDISALTEAESANYRNRHIGFVWQIHYLLPEFTALENVMMPLLIRGEAREPSAAKAISRLKDVGLEARSAHRAGELSGGEQQRVVLARALISEPSLLLADEPTGNLDARTGAHIFGLIQDLHQHFGLTSVLVTHNLAFAAQCDRALRLENGALVPHA